MKEANALAKECLEAGMAIRLSERNGMFICIVERAWITVEAATLNAAIIDACTQALAK